MKIPLFKIVTNHLGIKKSFQLGVHGGSVIQATGMVEFEDGLWIEIRLKMACKGFRYIQLSTSDYKRLLDKPYENEVTLTGEFKSRATGSSGAGAGWQTFSRDLYLVTASNFKAH